MTNEEIVKQIKNDELKGSEEALRQIYNESFFVIEQMILNNNGTVEDAKDVYHDAFVVFYNNAKKPNFILNSKISTYLYAVCRNIWFAKLREAKKYVNVDNSFIHNLDQKIEIPDKKQYTEKAELLADLLEKSGQKCLELLKMFYFEKLKMKEISEAFGYSSEQVAKNQKVRCLKKLRNILHKKNIRSGAFNI